MLWVKERAENHLLKRPFSPNHLFILLWLLLGLVAWWLWQEPLRTFWALLQDQTAVSRTLQQFGWRGPLVLALAQFLQVLVAIIPGQGLVIAAGYVYGFLPGLLMNLAYTVSASQLCFALARRWGRPFVHRLASPAQVEKWHQLGQQRGFAFFTISFMLPLFPTDVMNFVAGLTGISNRHFFAANLLGRLPGTILLTYIGSFGTMLTPRQWLVVGLIWAALFLAGRYAVNRFHNQP